MVRITHLCVISLSLALPAAALAQSGESAEQIAAKLMRQEQTYRLRHETQEKKYRGLVIVPTGQELFGSDDAAATAPADYVRVAPEDQVNVHIVFDFDSASLRADQKPKFAAICQAMKSVDAALFQIVGHTDSAGSVAYNERLSLLRAAEVKRYLVQDCGIPADRLQAVGLGESSLLDTRHPRAEVNRRVEFQALG